MSLRQAWWDRVLQLSYGRIFLISLVPRVALLAYLYPDVLLGDAQYYWDEAIRISVGELPDVYWPPLLPLWLSGWARIFGPYNWVAALATLCLWAVFYLVFARQSEENHSTNKGLLILFSFYPAFVFQSIVPLSQLPMGLLILLVVRVWRNGPHIYKTTLSGLMLGLAVLVRPGSLSIWPMLALMRPNGVERWPRLQWLIPASLWVLGWMFYVQLHTGQWIFVNQASSYNLFIGNHPDSPHYKNWWLGSHLAREDLQFETYYQTLDSIRGLPVLAQDQAFQEVTWRYIRQEPGIFLRRSWNRLKVFWAFDSLAGASLSKFNPLLGLIVLGIDALLFLIVMGWVLRQILGQDSLGKQQISWLGLSFCYQIPYLLAFSHPSYHLPVLVILTVMPFSTPIRGWTNDRSGRLWLTAMALLLLIQAEWIWHMSGSL